MSMGDPVKNNQADNDIPFHCAYNFPAVLLTQGKKSWPKLQALFLQLIRDSRWKVRRTLAFSLFEIARILGPQTTESELIPVMNHFLKDINEVREGVLFNMPKFFKVLTPEKRELYIDILAQSKIDSQDWRKREVLASQLKKYAKLFKPETVYKHYVPLFYNLCQDPVAEVRIAAARTVGSFLNKLSSH